VEQEIRALFSTYENRNLADFKKYVASAFRTRDTFGFGLSQVHVAHSVDGDFRNLRAVEFNVSVSVPQYSADRKQARVDVRWHRRARFPVSGEEWIVRNQRSTLLFGVRRGQLRFTGIEGDPVFGLTNTAGVLTVDRGTIDGVDVGVPLSVLHGRLAAGAQDLFAFGNQRRFLRPGATATGGADQDAPVVTPESPPAAAPPPPPAAPMPDLVLTNADVTVVPDPPSLRRGRFQVVAVVRNAGPVAAGAFEVRSVASFTGTPQTGRVTGLSAGASLTVRFTYGTPAPGVHTVTVTADSGGVVAESSEANNVGTRQFTSVR
jgi:hypothetical protein